MAVTAIVLIWAAYSFVHIDGTQRVASIRSLADLSYQPGAVATTSVGEEFTLDGMRYTVSGAVSRGRNYGFQHTEGRFIEVAIDVTNTGPAPAIPDAVALIDENSVLFEQVPLFSKDRTSYWEALQSVVPPGESKVYFALFDVASGSSGLRLSLHGKDGAASRIVLLRL